MPHFLIDDDVVELVSKLAKPRAFEGFSDALRRVLEEVKSGGSGSISQAASDIGSSTGTRIRPLPLDKMRGIGRAVDRVRAPSPDARLWVSRVKELESVQGLNSWRAVCDHLEIEVGGDSARRKLQEWVETNRPGWPEVPNA